MRTSQILKTLRDHKDERVSRYGVTDFAVFGSVASGFAESTSDVDILVRFDGPATAPRYSGVQFHREDLLGQPVDLVTDKALRAELRPYVERDAIHV